jgi:hypothetical protein
MKTDKVSVGMIGLALLSLLISACSIDLSRNPDGSVGVEVLMPEESVQEELSAGLTNPLIRDLAVELHDGYAQVTGERERPMGDGVDQFSFELRLGVEDGHLAATISDAKLNGYPVDAARVGVWNEHMAARLARSGRRHPNAELLSVRITEEGLSLHWRVETARSRGS